MGMMTNEAEAAKLHYKTPTVNYFVLQKHKEASMFQSQFFLQRHMQVEKPKENEFKRINLNDMNMSEYAENGALYILVNFSRETTHSR